ncbi:salt stress protein, Slr1339 family [Pseudanabaena minima]|uniref:salt stress protein, Slr1339 family n=1 Tax=Pseudanabaena minima TaxID=890415 RepID=UPI003DA8D3F7
MESLESILSDLQGKYKDPNKEPNANKQHQDQPIATSPLPSQTSIPAPNSLDSLLNDLRNNSQSHSQSNSQTYAPDYTSPQVTSETLTSQPSPVIDRDLQQIADRQKAKDQEAISKTATEWLKKLDPLGGEGLWFEEFAKNYPSRLEAAIALLQST